MRQKALCPPARGTLVIAMCNQARMATVLLRTPTRWYACIRRSFGYPFPAQDATGSSRSSSFPSTPFFVYPLIGFVTAVSRGHRSTNSRSLLSSSEETLMFLCFFCFFFYLLSRIKVISLCDMIQDISGEINRQILNEKRLYCVTHYDCIVFLILFQKM